MAIFPFVNDKFFNGPFLHVRFDDFFISFEKFPNSSLDG